jgi:hypothetical protein
VQLFNHTTASEDKDIILTALICASPECVDKYANFIALTAITRRVRSVFTFLRFPNEKSFLGKFNYLAIQCELAFRPLYEAIKWHDASMVSLSSVTFLFLSLIFSAEKAEFNQEKKSEKN